jgi:hypothetical protein
MNTVCTVYVQGKLENVSCVAIRYRLCMHVHVCDLNIYVIYMYFIWMCIFIYIFYQSFKEYDSQKQG